MRLPRAAAQDVRSIAANTARDLALSLRLASLRMENFEPGQGKDAARELAEQLSASARRAVELYYLESLTQAVAISEGPLRVRRKAELEFLAPDEAMEVERLKSEVAGCYNKVGFTLLLECELERARRRNAPLSLVIFKLDSPDEDLVQEVARQGREGCRLLDVLGTFDRRGVGILLPDTGPEGTEVATNRLLTSLASSRKQGGGLVDRLLVGVASHPQDHGDSRDLLRLADRRAGGRSLLEEIATAR